MRSGSPSSNGTTEHIKSSVQRSSFSATLGRKLSAAARMLRSGSAKSSSRAASSRQPSNDLEVALATAEIASVAAIARTSSPPRSHDDDDAGCFVGADSAHTSGGRTPTHSSRRSAVAAAASKGRSLSGTSQSESSSLSLGLSWHPDDDPAACDPLRFQTRYRTISKLNRCVFTVHASPFVAWIAAAPNVFKCTPS